jgi:hypothetical protein
MRCPACNTENTPDSRFCGGCGAKLAIAEPRVAPTAKIPDDAPFQAPAPGAYTSAYAAGPISYAPPSMPPRMPSSPPVAPPPTRVPEASLSMPVPRRRTGLIATVVVIDLVLAGAGGLLLAKGLEPPAAPVSISPAPTPTPTPSPPPTPQTTSITPAAPIGSAADVAIGSALDHIAAATPTPPPAPPPTPQHVAAKKPAPTSPPAPIDPYDMSHALANEVELAASRAGPDFEHCLDAALRENAIHGAIHVSFNVVADGRVATPKITQNTTGSSSLATCLTTIISGWTFATHPAHATSFTRPFSYP